MTRPLPPSLPIPAPALRIVALAAALLAGVAAARAETAAGAPAPQPDPSGVTLSLPTRRAPQKPAPGCTPVRRIEVRGVVLIDPEALRGTLAPLAVACVGNDEVKALLAALNGAYSDRGYVTTQGYLPEQDLRRSGMLAINVIAGRIDRIVYRENRGDEALPLADRMGRAWSKVAGAAGPWSLVSGLSGLFDRLDDPLDDVQILPRGLEPDPKVWSGSVAKPGDVVQIDAIQQGIDQINRVASSHAQVKLEPGDRPATSRVVVENAVEDSFRLNAGYELNGADINGSGRTIPSRLKLDMAKDNLVGLNDAWRLSYAGGLDSNEARGAVSIPFRRLTVSVDGGYSESLSGIAPGVELFSRDGTLSATAGYLLYRSRDRQVTLDETLSWRTGERFVNGVSLAPQTITHVRTGLSEVRTFDAWQLTYGAGLDRGLPVLGAAQDPADILPGTPRAEFLKLDGQGSLARALAGTGLLRVDVSGQWTGHPLYSDDQLVLGSVTTVRGFTNSAVRADRGVVLRAEFAPALPADRILGDRKQSWVFLAEALSGLQPYLFADYGAGRDIADRESLQRAGIGAGLRYRHGRVNLDVSIGEPVYRAGGPRPKQWQAPEAYLTVSVKLL